MNLERVKLGWWIRFNSRGRLVIGVVEYIQKEGNVLAGYKTTYITDKGPATLDKIVEVRGPNGEVFVRKENS